MIRQSEPGNSWTGPFVELIMLTTVIVERNEVGSLRLEASASTTNVPVMLRPSTVPSSTLQDSHRVLQGSTAVHRTGADGSTSPLVSRTAPSCLGGLRGLFGQAP
jgi:hypothetical protein